MADFRIPNEKLDQVAGILRQEGVDCWISLVSETRLNPDPALDLILGLEMTWLSAFVVTAQDERFAILGRYDAQAVEQMGGYQQVIPYDEDFAPAFRELIFKLDPERIALNYSETDTASDGLSHGLWLSLNKILEGSPYPDRFVSAEGVISALRGRKTPTEIEKVRKAVQITEKIVAALAPELKEGLSEVQLYEQVRAMMAVEGVQASWDPCPNVSIGPESSVGHAMPDAAVRLQAGQLVHLDLGVELDGYVSDLQRVWYFAKAGETKLPEPVQEAFDAVRSAILAAAAVLKPGVEGWQVDLAARECITSLGYPEYRHAVGHQIGRSVHDGAGVLAPRWPRYGRSAFLQVEANNLFTLELGLFVPGYGFLGLEEDVWVREAGLEWLSQPQTEIFFVPYKR